MKPNSRIVLITGAGQGIGAKYAHEFAAQGDKVVAADINGDAVEKVAAEIQSAGHDAIGLPVDVSDEASVSKLVEQTVERYGTIHVLINNAAIFSSLKMKPFENIHVDEWEKVFAVNARGVLLMCQAVAPYMKRQQFGRIVNISSSVVVTGRPNYAHYIASKGAVQAFNKALATELGEYEITANVVSPHGIVTEIPRETVTDDDWEDLLKEHSIKRKGTPEDVVSAVKFFASNGAGYITGQSLLVDAGLRYT